MHLDKTPVDELVDPAVSRVYLWSSVNKASVRADEADALRARALELGMPALQVRQIELVAETNRHLASILALIAHTRWEHGSLPPPAGIRAGIRRLLQTVLAWL